MDSELLFNIVIQTIRNEPELPNKPTKEVLNTINTILINKDTDAFINLLRHTVSITKQSIINNVCEQVLLTNRTAGSFQ